MIAKLSNHTSAASCMPSTKDQAQKTWAYVLTENPISNLSVHGMILNQLNHSSQGFNDSSYDKIGYHSKGVVLGGMHSSVF